MGQPAAPSPVKLFVGMLSQDTSLFDELRRKLQNAYGPADFESPVWNWEHTDYYKDEMGGGLKRTFAFFEKLIHPGDVAGIKLKTNELEQQYLNETGGRRINLDPGYLDASKVVLVTTKNYSHRIYLDRGMYGEVTLMFSKNHYQPLPYTYPDYTSQEYRDLFKKARDMYMQQKNSQTRQL